MGRRPFLVLLPVLLLGLGLRLWGIGFGLDPDDAKNVNLCLIDERGMAKETLAGLNERSLDPGTFLLRGPSGYLVLLAADATVLGLRAASGPETWRQVLDGQRENPSRIHLVHRVMSTLAALATVALLWHTMRREFGATVGGLAALFLATSYLHVRESHLGETDTLWCLFTMAAVDRLLVLVRDPRRGRYVVAGLVAGVAAATKYFSVVLGLHLLLGHVVARRAAVERGETPPPWPRLLWAWGATPIGFFLVSPGVLLDFGTFVERMFFSVDTYGAPSDPWVQARAFFTQARYTLAIGLGEPVFVLALAGLVLGWRKGPAGRMATLSVLGLVPTILMTQHHPLRFGLALMVALVLPAALGGAALLERVPRAVGVAAIALAVTPSIVRSVFFDRLVGRRDTRLEMLEAVEALGQPKTEVFALGWHHGIPSRIHTHQSPFTHPRPEDRRNEGLFLKAFYAKTPRHVMIDWTLPWKDDETLQGIEAWVRERYREILVLDGTRPGWQVELPDPPDGRPSHMVPYARPWAMVRPGPPLTLFERIDP